MIDGCFDEDTEMSAEDEMEVALGCIQDLLNILSNFSRDDFDGYDLNTIKEVEDFLKGN
ncbi:hypothetical protein VP277E431_P0019 [Vibrio phage 277E43-1]|nr:hypothetical protein VP277E431_P0019 [Vibrio phage 277E43-1]